LRLTELRIKEVRASEIPNLRSEIGVIENVKKLTTELQPQVLVKLEIAMNTEIPLERSESS
jgi:hypothetical protein